MDELGTHCKKCGAPLGADYGPAYVLIERNIHGLAALLNGQLDEVQCEVCEVPLGIRPTVVVAFVDPPTVWFVPGSQLDVAEQGRLRGQIQERFTVQLEQLASLDALREAVGDRIRAHLAELAAVFAADDQWGYVLRHWRQLTPEVFAASYLSLLAPVPGVAIAVAWRDGDGEPTAEDVLRRLAEVQAQTWLGLCLSWTAGDDHSPTLEENLQRFVDRAVILPRALETLSDLFDSLQAKPDLMVHTRYCLEAVRASVYTVAEEPNPQASQWAEFFFAQELACRTEGDAISAELRAMTISEERGHATIGFRPAWDAVVRRLTQVLEGKNRAEQLDFMQRLEAVAAKAGYPDLLAQVLTEGLEIQVVGDLPVETLIEFARHMAAQVDTDEGFLNLFRAHGALLARQRRVGDLERFAEALLETMGDTRDAQARVEAWLGSFFKQLRLPQRFLQRIGEAPRHWEQNLPPRIQAGLWTERSNALRLLGRREEALQIAQDIVRLLAHSSDSDEKALAVARHNVAILLRETGAPDAALTALEAQLAQTEDEENKLGLLHSLATTYLALGQPGRALESLEQALKVAAGPRARKVPILDTARAVALAALGRYQDASQVLREVPVDQPLDPVAVIPRASAWTTILGNEPSLVSDEDLERLWDDLKRVQMAAKAEGDVQLYLPALCLMAWLMQILQMPQAVEFHLEAYREFERLGQPQDVAILLLLARHAYAQGNAEEARGLLVKVPEVLASELGGVSDLSVAVSSSKRLEKALDDLKQEVLFDPQAGAGFEDVRLVSEMSRDVVGRARMLRSRGLIRADPFALSQGLSDEVLRQLAPASGSVAVVEWVEAGEFQGCFCTRITAAGEVSSHWLEAPHLDEMALAKKMQSRLRGWWLGRPGDPFDLPEWRSLEQWLVDQLSLYLAYGDHLVFIEHEGACGLPWHVAAAPQWTASYVASWTRLLALFQHPKATKPASVGIVLVPRFGESVKVLAALKGSAQRTRSWAAGRNLTVVTTEETACDRDAFQAIMVEADVAEILCHGFVDADGEVYLMLAHNGSLPLATSVASGSAAGRAHRLSWRECQHLPAAPRIVFSAACSSGLSHVAGLGERLGLFNALVNAGTQAIVAPWWNVDAKLMLPILDDALERYVGNGQSLTQALHGACVDAEANNPRWLTWAFAIEGDWR